MGTVVPSGSVVVVGATVRLTCCWPKAAAAPKRKRAATTNVAFSVAFKVWIRIEFLVVIGIFELQGLINYKFTGIHQHHHQHSSGEDVVGGNFALVVGVPHEGEASFGARGIGNRPRGRSCSGLSAIPSSVVLHRIGLASSRSNGRVRPQVGTSAIPRTVRENGRIGQSCRPAARDVAR